jgi:hypothetical protein
MPMRNYSEVSTQGGDQLSDYGANFPGVVVPQLPSLTVTGFFAPATSDRFGEVSNIYQLGDTLRWFHGRHSISAGGEFTRNEYFGHGASVNQGVISFGGGITTNAFADFLIGKPGPGSISEAVAMRLPVIVERNAWTLPQERYNPDWVLERGAGLVLPNFRGIRGAVIKMTSTLDEYRANVAKIENRAVFEIPEILGQILERTRPA